MGKPQDKRQATAPPPGESPTKKPHTKEHHKKSAKQFPSKEQTARTPSTPRKLSNSQDSGTNDTQDPETATPKTPASAKLLGTKKATATAVRKHATASNTSLHRMLEKLMDMVMEKQASIGRGKKSPSRCPCRTVGKQRFIQSLTIRIQCYLKEKHFQRLPSPSGTVFAKKFN